MAKSARIITWSFGWVMGGDSARRERTMRVVMEGWRRAWRRTSPPMKPVAPVRMTFILVGRRKKLVVWVLLEFGSEDIRAQVGSKICDSIKG